MSVSMLMSVSESVSVSMLMMMSMFLLMSLWQCWSVLPKGLSSPTRNIPNISKIGGFWGIFQWNCPKYQRLSAKIKEHNLNEYTSGTLFFDRLSGYSLPNKPLRSILGAVLYPGSTNLAPGVLDLTYLIAWLGACVLGEKGQMAPGPCFLKSMLV